MQKQMFDALVINAVDFLKVSLKELTDRPKYSVIHFCSGVEIFFKARLLAEHWALVAIKPGSASLSEFQAGKSRTVGLPEAVERLRRIASETFASEAVTTFSNLRERRNRLVHFCSADFVGASVNNRVIESVAAEQCRAWLHLHKLLLSQWRDYFTDFTSQIEELNQLIQEHRVFLREKFKSLAGELTARMESDIKIATCSSCGFHAATVSNAKFGVRERECLVCDACERYLPVRCPHCEEEQSYWGEGDTKCDHCGGPITVDDIIQEWAYKGGGPKDMTSVELGYCCGCEHLTPSVALIGDEDNWVCLACLESHEAPERCDWCGELVTGDWEGSGYFGCLLCDGKRGQGGDDD